MTAAPIEHPGSEFEPYSLWNLPSRVAASDICLADRAIRDLRVVQDAQPEAFRDLLAVSFATNSANVHESNDTIDLLTKENEYWRRRVDLFESKFADSETELRSLAGQLEKVPELVEALHSAKLEAQRLRKGLKGSVEKPKVTPVLAIVADVDRQQESLCQALDKSQEDVLNLPERLTHEANCLTPSDGLLLTALQKFDSANKDHQSLIEDKLTTIKMQQSQLAQLFDENDILSSELAKTRKSALGSCAGAEERGNTSISELTQQISDQEKTILSLNTRISELLTMPITTYQPGTARELMLARSQLKTTRSERDYTIQLVHQLQEQLAYLQRRILSLVAQNQELSSDLVSKRKPSEDADVVMGCTSQEEPPVLHHGDVIEDMDMQITQLRFEKEKLETELQSARYTPAPRKNPPSSISSQDFACMRVRQESGVTASRAGAGREEESLANDVNLVTDKETVETLRGQLLELDNRFKDIRTELRDAHALLKASRFSGTLRDEVCVHIDTVQKLAEEYQTIMDFHRKQMDALRAENVKLETKLTFRASTVLQETNSLPVKRKHALMTSDGSTSALPSPITPKRTRSGLRSDTRSGAINENESPDVPLAVAVRRRGRKHSLAEPDLQSASPSVIQRLALSGDLSSPSRSVNTLSTMPSSASGPESVGKGQLLNTMSVLTSSASLSLQKHPSIILHSEHLDGVFFVSKGSQICLFCRKSRLTAKFAVKEGHDVLRAHLLDTHLEAARQLAKLTVGDAKLVKEKRKRSPRCSSNTDGTPVQSEADFFSRSTARNGLPTPCHSPSAGQSSLSSLNRSNSTLPSESRMENMVGRSSIPRPRHPPPSLVVDSQGGLAAAAGQRTSPPPLLIRYPQATSPPSLRGEEVIQEGPPLKPREILGSQPAPAVSEATGNHSDPVLPLIVPATMTSTGVSSDSGCKTLPLLDPASLAPNVCSPVTPLMDDVIQISGSLFDWLHPHLEALSGTDERTRLFCTRRLSRIYCTLFNVKGEDQQIRVSQRMLELSNSINLTGEY